MVNKSIEIESIVEKPVYIEREIDQIQFRNEFGAKTDVKGKKYSLRMAIDSFVPEHLQDSFLEQLNKI